MFQELRMCIPRGKTIWIGLCGVVVATGAVALVVVKLGFVEQPVSDGRGTAKDPPYAGDPGHCEAASEEQGLLDIVKTWEVGHPQKDGRKYVEKMAHAKRVADAMCRLGELKSKRAIPILVEKIGFAYLPRVPDKYIFYNPSLSETSPPLRALRSIGREALDEVVNRLGELDPGADFFSQREPYLLRQVILGILDRKEAITLLKEEAKGTTDGKVRDRLLLSATRIASEPLSE